MRGAPDRERGDQRARLGRQRGGPRRERRPVVEQAHRDAVRPVPPVDQQREDLLPPQHGEQLAQVAPRDDVHAPRLALPAEQLEQLGERRVIGHHVGGIAAMGDRGGDRLVVAHVPGDHDHRTPGLGPRRGEAVDAVALDAVGELLRRPRGQPHELDHVGRVLAVGAEGEAPDVRVVGRQPEHAAEVDVGVATLRRPGEVAALGGRADHGPGQARRDVRQHGGGTTVAEDRRALDDARRGRIEAPVGRLEPAVAPGHFAAAAFAFAWPASAFESFFDSSVPTSVSLSSPRMNASTRLNAMSSWIWMGGDFMK